MLDLFLNGKRLRVSDADLLGEGGEARVFRHGDLALKVFHATDALKEKKLNDFPKRLPAEVVAPLGVLTDRQQRIAGYAMPKVEGAQDFARLSNRRFRENAVSNAQVLGLHAALAQTLEALHSRGVVVGDLNDGNVLFAGARHFLIDADSMQFSGLPCPVGHERFLDPRLYGVDLTRAPRFDPGTDWYAWAVLWFSALLYVHPFGGTHPTLPTPLRRAEARHSILRSDVKYPRHAAHFSVLPDDALQWLTCVFEKDLRAPPPPALHTLQFSRCACGIEHARAVCPECQALGPASLRQATRFNGRCTARSVFRTPGRVLAAALRGGLRYVYEESGAVRREDFEPVVSAPVRLGTQFFSSGQATFVVEPEGQVLRIERGRTVERLSTGLRGSTPVFAASSNAAYRLEREWLIECFTGARVGQVLEGHTYLWSGERRAFGFYRAGGFTQGFIVEHGKAGLRPVQLPALAGRIADAHATFDDAHVLLHLIAEQGGVESGLLFLLSGDGSLLAQARGPASDRIFKGVRGSAVLGGRVLRATDDGLLSLKADAGQLLEARLFSDSEPFVSSDVELLPAPDGSVHVVSSKEILQLSLS